MFMTLISNHQPIRLLNNLHVTNAKADRAVTMFERKSCGFYCVYKQRHKDVYQGDMSHGTRLSDLTRSSSSNIFLLLWGKLKSSFIISSISSTVWVIFQYLAGGLNRFVKGVGGGQISDHDNWMFDYLSLSVCQPGVRQGEELLWPPPSSWYVSLLIVSWPYTGIWSDESSSLS